MSRQVSRPPPVVFAAVLLFWLQVVQAGVTVQVGQDFTGSTYGGNLAGLPPDPNGSVGPHYFVEFINGSIAVYNKTNGLSVQRKSDLKFWSDAGLIISPDSGVSDPRIIYDPTVQRWFASQADLNANATDPTVDANDFLLAVSDTSDPTGPWHGFSFQADPDTGYFADFPTLGVDGGAVYLSGDMYSGMENPMGPALVSIPKADLLASPPTIANRTWFGIMSYAERGQVLQPATCLDGSATGSVVAVGDIGMDSDPHSNLVFFAVQNVTVPGGATLTAPTSISVDPYVVPFDADQGVPMFTPVQPDGTTTLAGNDARFSGKVYAVGGVLYAVHNTELNGRIAIRWYRIDTATRALLESGTIADAGLDLVYPSIAANADGTVVIAYNGCGLSTDVGCYAIAGETLGGVTTFGTPILLQSGAAVYHGDDELLDQVLGQPPLSRWGDYSAISVDPSDPTRFWIIEMYPSDTDIWSTRITELITGRPLRLSLKPAGPSLTISWPAASGAGYQLQSTTNPGMAGGWSTVTLPVSTNGGQASVTVPNSGAQEFFRLQHP